MPLQNRVTPEGEIIATPARGTMFGNRGGCFHRDDQTLTRRRWHAKAWITCTLAFKNRRRALMQPGRYTELFFLDEATALAAGHRPCFECRRNAAVAFSTLWARVVAAGSAADKPSTFVGAGCEKRARAGAMDELLHAQRLTDEGGKRHYRDTISALPDGAFISWQGSPHVIVHGALYLWTAQGYRRADSPPSGSTNVEVLTPPATIAVILSGYAPKLHPSFDPLVSNSS